MRIRWGPEGDKRWDMSVQDTQSWNGGVRDGDAYLEYSEAVGTQRPVSDHGCL